MYNAPLQMDEKKRWSMCNVLVSTVLVRKEIVCPGREIKGKEVDPKGLGMMQKRRDRVSDLSNMYTRTCFPTHI
jgi:hypothetical protein